MINTKLKKLLRIRNYLLQQLCDNIGMTPNGLRKALKNDDFKISTLKQISKFLDVDISYWFVSDEEAADVSKFFLNNNGNFINRSVVKNSSQKNEANQEKIKNLLLEVEFLKKEVLSKAETIALKDEIIKLLKDKIEK